MYLSTTKPTKPSSMTGRTRKTMQLCIFLYNSCPLPAFSPSLSPKIEHFVFFSSCYIVPSIHLFIYIHILLAGSVYESEHVIIFLSNLYDLNIMHSKSIHFPAQYFMIANIHIATLSRNSKS